MARVIVYGLIILLAILHQDFWWWDDSATLVFGFVPVGLAWHVAVSIMAAGLWAAAVVFCWPQDVDVQEAEVIAGDREEITA